jgi:hypothetical protein
MSIKQKIKAAQQVNPADRLQLRLILAFSTNEMKTQRFKTCAICGKNPATTRDHIPPKGIFPKPRPSDLITIPACGPCNKSTSDFDEVFKVFMGIAAGHGPEGERMFKEQTVDTLQHNQRLKKEIAGTFRNVFVKTPGGIILGKKPAVLLNSKAHDQIIEKTIRGLHFHHTGNILGDQADISINWHYSLTEKMYKMSMSWMTGVVGNGQFIYKFFTHPEEPLASVWILQFFNRAWSSGTVLPKGKGIRSNKSLQQMAYSHR